MKFTAVSVACLATSAYARTQLVQRDLATVTGVIGNVGSGVEKLDAAINAYSGNAQPVKDAADSLIATLKDGKTKVDGSSDLTLADALGLQAPVTALQDKAKKLAGDFETKKPDIQKANMCSTVRGELADISTNSQALISSVVSKVPKDAQSIAKNLADGVIQLLNKAADDFSENKCKDGGGSSSSAAGGSSSAAGGSSSAAGGSSSTGAASTGPATTGAGTMSSVASSGGGGSMTATGTGGGVVPTGGATTPSMPTGTGYPSGTKTGMPPIVTAGAALFAPAGALAVAVVVAVL